MPEIHVTAPAECQRYPIQIESGLLQRCSAYFSSLTGRRAVIVTDANVGPLYGDILQKQLSLAGVISFIHTIPAGEPSKSPEQLFLIYDFLMDHGITRKDAIIALGGGVVGDLSGYAAASWMRGIRFIQVPTTLLAQVDSSVGGKVAINHARGKNLIGAFYQPEMVLIDPDILSTLDERQFGAGLGEVIKYGCLADAELFEMIERCNSRATLRPHLPEIIARCCAIKSRYVLEDPHDHGIRIQLNFGHTLAHAIENLSGYGVILHGEAVCIGMCAAASWGESLGLTPRGTGNRIKALLQAYDLPVSPAPSLSVEALCKSMAMDKKGEGATIRLVLLDRLGHCDAYPIPVKDLDHLMRNAHE